MRRLRPALAEAIWPFDIQPLQSADALRPSMINSLFFHPLGPSLLLALGAAVLMLVARLPQQRARWTLAIALAATLLSLLLLAILRTPSGTQTSLHTLSWVWQPLIVTGGRMEWQLDRWNWLAALIIGLMAMTSLALQDADEPRELGTPRAARTLLLAAAAMAFVFSNNLLAVATCAVLLDAALAYRLAPGYAEFPAGRTWGMLSLATLPLLVVLVLAGEGNIHADLLTGDLTRTQLGLLWLSAMVRAGIYPLHLWQPRTGTLDAGDRVALHLLAPLAGIWLLARIHGLGGVEWAEGLEWGVLGAAALLGTAIGAWTADEDGETWRWLALNRAALALAGAYRADPAGPPVFVWALVAFALGPALLALGLAVRSRWGWTMPLWIGVLATWGFPGTPGFLARASLVFPAGSPLAWPIFALAMVAETLLVAALWRLVFAPGPDAAAVPHGRRGVVRLSIAAALLGAATLAWGVAPRQLLQLVALLPVPENSSLWQSVGDAPASTWIAFAVSGILGVLLGAYRGRVFGSMRGWQQGAAQVVNMEWAYQTLNAGLLAAGAALRYFATVGEGEGYLGWLALAGMLLVALLVT